MVTTTIARSMDIDLLSVDQILCGHQISIEGETNIHTITIVTTVQGKVDIEHIRADIKKTWKRRDGPSTSNGGVT